MAQTRFHSLHLPLEVVHAKGPKQQVLPHTGAFVRRWALIVWGSGEPASPAGTRRLWLAPSEPEVRVPYGGHRKAVSSCGGPSARVPSGSSHSWDSWPSPHSSACRILTQGRQVLQRSFPFTKLMVSICMLNGYKQPLWLLPNQRERVRCVCVCVWACWNMRVPPFSVWEQTLLGLGCGYPLHLISTQILNCRISQELQ